MTDREYTVSTVVGSRDVKLGHGDFKSYTVVLDGEDKQVGLLQKPETAPPKAGDSLFGHIEEKNGFRNFKKAQRQGGFAGAPRPEDPKRAARILRQHSQTTAMQALDLMQRLGLLEPPPATRAEFFGLLVKTMDWFDKDADKAAEAAA